MCERRLVRRERGKAPCEARMPPLSLSSRAANARGEGATVFILVSGHTYSIYSSMRTHIDVWYRRVVPAGGPGGAL